MKPHTYDNKNLPVQAINIQWDATPAEQLTLPSEMTIPSDIAATNDNDAISDYLSNMTGYCHLGYELSVTRQVQSKEQ